MQIDRKEDRMYLKLHDPNDEFPLVIIQCAEVVFFGETSEGLTKIRITKLDGTKEESEVLSDYTIYIMNDDGKTIDRYN